MKQPFKNYLKLALFLFGTTLLLTTCQKEDTIEELETNNGILKIEQIPYASVKNEHKLFIKRFNISSDNTLFGRTESTSVIIDTSNVTQITYEDYTSYTFPVVSEDTDTTLKNVSISEHSDGTNSYFLMSYELDTTLDQVDASNVETHIINKSGSEIMPEDISYASREENGGDCWSVDTYSTDYCENAAGNIIRDNGQLGNGCVRNWHTVTVTVLTIDLGCSGGGGNSSTPNQSNPYGDGNTPIPGGDNSSQGGIPSGSSLTKPTTPCRSSTGFGGSDGCGGSLDAIERDNLFQVLSPYLNQEQANWITFEADIRVVEDLNDFIESSTIYNQTENYQFAAELISLAETETNQNDVTNLVNLTLLIENSEDQLFTEEFATSLFEYIDLDLSTLPPDFPSHLLTLKVFLNYKKLRQLNPEWSRGKCIWEATKDIVHISLDVFGLIPVVGEVADLANGVIYIIEGDTLNASLSVASAIPFVGWATAGTKFGLKIVNVANDINSKVKLVWKVTANGLIDFGSRSTLAKVLGTVGSGQHAHHLIPWATREFNVVQKAAKSGDAFHMNEALNGIARQSDLHLTGHNHYNDVVSDILNGFNPNANVEEAYDFVSGLANHIRELITNNPTLNSGQIANLISYP